MNKLKIAFDPATTWDYELFRNLIKDMFNDNLEIDLYLVTTNDDSTFINDVAIEIGGMETNRIFQLADTNTLINTLANNNILIFLSPDNQVVTDIYNTIPLLLNYNNITGCEGILVGNILDTFKLQPKYITILQFWIKQIEKYTSSGREAENC